MDRPASRPLSPFEKFVSVIAAVPKAEADEAARREDEKPRIKPGPKPGTKPKRRPAA
jgi:hypothetical protein